MRRTYRSKKDMTGTLDHRDVLHNMDEKSSVFDAFYIQNIKQTKRELSCVGALNPLGIASNKVRKRKYVRRIVKEAEIIKQRESSMSPVGYLTPDKSFRVNKPLDPFDLLLNSSPACQVAKTPVKVDVSKMSQPKKAGKTYIRKKLKKVKKIRYSSSDSSDSDKENSSSHCNITDIRSHKLLVEKEPSTSPKNFDESIHKIVNNLSLLSNIKRKSSNSFNTSFKHIKKRLSRNNSPILQKSPLCSTPFKEKYRGKSIYAFSPISIKRQSSSPNYATITEENHDSKNSILFVTANKSHKLSKESYELSPKKVLDVDDKIKDNTVGLQKSDDIFVDEIDMAVPENLPLDEFHKSMENKSKSSIDGSLTDEITNTMIENSPKPSLIKDKSFDITEFTPFLGFSENNEEDIDQNTPEKKNRVSTIEPILQTTEAELFLGFSKVNESLIKDKEYLHEHLEEVSKIETNDNNSSTIESSENDKTTETVNSYHSDDSVSSLHDISERESMYDTCSDMSSNDNMQSEGTKEPIVYIERMDFDFIRRYINKIHSDFNNPTDSTNVSEIDNISDHGDPDTAPEEEKNDYSDNNKNKDTPTKSNTDNTNASENDNNMSNNSDSDNLSNISENSKIHNDFNNSTDSTNISENYNISDIRDPDTETEEENDNSNSNKNDDTFDKNSTDNSDVSENDNLMSNNSDSDNSSNISDNDNTIRYKFNKTSNISNNDKTDVTKNENLSNISDPDIVSNISENEDLNSTRNIKRPNISNVDNSNVSHNDNTSFISIATDSNETEPKNGITITDSDDITSNDDDASEEEAYISFVTTRRKNDFINKDSMFMFENDNSFVSSSTDCDKTVLSNKVNLTRQSINLNETEGEFEHETEPNNLEAEISAGSYINEQLNRVTVRKSRLTRQSNVDPYENSDVTLTEKAAEVNTVAQTECNETQEENERISFVSTRKCSTNSFRESSVSCMDFSRVEVKPSIVLHPGKKWERSLSIYRRMTMMTDHFDQSILEDEDLQSKGRNYRQSVLSTMEMQDSLHNESITSRRSTFVSKPSRPTIRFVKDTNGNDSRLSLNNTTVYDDLKGFLNEECDDTVIELSKLSLADSHHEVTVLEPFHESERVTTAKDYVLRRCNQTEPLLFDECYPETILKNCHKIGEGVYGEVYLFRARDGRVRVMKIVPIAGHVKVNGEQQKDFHEIISEIVIAMELSALRAPIAEIDRNFEEGKRIDEIDLRTVENATDVFNEVLAVRCVYGPYPSRLLDLWELYDECKGSENDNPASLPVDQQYIVLELANAGQDLESFQFTSAQQAHALFQQIAFGLAVGEEAFQFEHRDLHWGNVLIAPTEQKYATFVLRNRVHRVPRGGVAATIIDYSLSRVSLALAGERDCSRATLYNDLATDDALFDAVGDYQFEVYRLMKDKLGNEWKNFEPYTNILWLHYTVDKMITALRYKRTNTKIHKHYIEKLKGIKDRILTYSSATDYVLTDNDI